MNRFVFILLPVVLTFGALFSQTPQLPKVHTPPRPEIPSVTKHTLMVGGKSLSYTATTGYLPVSNDSGKVKANIFFIAYEKEGEPKKSARPLTFSFNGGPGSSSVWLHLGALGPKRVLMADDVGNPTPPPYTLVPNEYTWLEFTDLVFIDPVWTGYSRPIPGENKRQFHGVEEDIASVGEFIRLYTTKAERWSSPKFLVGESYGTTRAVGLSDYLIREYGMYLNGMMLVSSILQFETARFGPGRDLPHVLFLPTFTATAWYHKKLSPDLQRDLTTTLAEVRRWALADYLVALAKGDAIGKEEYEKTLEQLSRFTGLSKEYLARTNLRPSIQRFVKELLREERRTVGRLDSRFKGMDRDAAGENYEYDPSYAVIYGPYSATLNDYVRTELKYTNDLPYEILTGKVQPWNWGSASDGFPNLAERMRRAMNQNPAMKVFVANGYYDLATPFFATEYTFNHLSLEPELRRNVTMAYYEAGHMMYIHKPSLQKLYEDVKKFVNEAKGR